tara:strand:+ start:886 stop:1059 length:174 start_codon:yes stop_codon:yes gene_type:complete
MIAVMEKDDYRTFTQKVQELQHKGYDLPFVAEKMEDNWFKVTIHGDHDPEELDKLVP